MKILYDVSDHINTKDVYFEITDKLIIYTYSVLNFKDVKMFLSKYNIRKSTFTHKYYSKNLKYGITHNYRKLQLYKTSS